MNIDLHVHLYAQAKACGCSKTKGDDHLFMSSVIIGIFFLLSLFPFSLHAQTSSIHHDLGVTLSPKDHRLAVVDSITLPNDFPNEVRFSLHAGLNPSSSTPGVRIEKQTKTQEAVPLESYTITLPPGLRTFVIAYAGNIYHPLEQYGTEQARGFQETPGIISGNGVVLSAASCWYPAFGQGLMTFNLEVNLPPAWDAVSQGAATHHEKTARATSVRWESPELQEEIFLIASRFTEYTRPAGSALAMVFLRTPDDGLAEKYLDATENYLDLYSRLIGPYPYKKFALVENFWETGFGMPSFTLLGPKVIRLPFIIDSSYPHELLHNWWGNCVFPDYGQGNWSEGLTAYLADHLIKEQQGAGAEYRVNTLQKYADYALGNRDFPLTKFTSRRSSSSEAIGYGKSLMFFHMLRQDLGDETFRLGLRKFYQTYRFRFAAFDDLRTSFEAVSGKSLSAAFEQWVTRTGAPQLTVSNSAVVPEEGGFMLTAVLEQTQPGDAYHLRVPVAVTMEGREQAFQTTIEMNEKRRELKIFVPARPQRLDIDPEFDLFRKLDREEMPPAISQALGAKKMLVILPSRADKGLLRAYRELADSLAQSGPDEVDRKLDTELKALPVDRAVTILGWENRFLKEITSNVSAYGVAVSEQSVRIDRTVVPRKNHALALTARLPQNRDLALLFIASDLRETLPGLGRKLPHYHKYSYLVFEGQEPANIAKGRWPTLNSPLTVFVPAENGAIKKVGMAGLAQREPLAARAPETPTPLRTP